MSSMLRTLIVDDHPISFHCERGFNAHSRCARLEIQHETIYGRATLRSALIFGNLAGNSRRCRFHILAAGACLPGARICNPAYSHVVWMCPCSTCCQSRSTCARSGGSARPLRVGSHLTAMEIEGKARRTAGPRVLSWCSRSPCCCTR